MEGKLFITFLIGFFFVSFFIFTKPTLASSSWAGNEEGYDLKNGLRVILAPNDSSPVVSIRLLIKAGSTSEKVYEDYGLAHLMEHMAFKDTAKRKTGEISKLLESRGGDMNAYTSHDETVYYLTLPAQEVGLGLDILADMVFYPSYNPEEYSREKEVVIEEIKRGDDNPDRLLMETFWELMYPNHAYGRPVIGFEETVFAVSLERAKAFHQEFYRPDNAILVVVGSFDSLKVKKTVEELFASISNPRLEIDKNEKPEEKKLLKITYPQVKILKSEQTDLAKVLIAFKGPSYSDPSAPQADLLAAILSEGRASRLYERIQRSQALVSGISSFSHTPKDSGVFVFSFESEAKKVKQATEAVLMELNNLFIEEPTLDEMSRARILAEKTFLNQQQTVSGQAGQIISFETMAGDWRLKDSYLAIWNRSKVADLLKAGREIFTKDSLSITLMLPLDYSEEEQLSKELEEIAKNFKLPKENIVKKNIAPFETLSLTGGGKLMVQREPSLPLVAVRVGFLGGSLFETEEQSGLINFLVSSWTRSTEKRKADQLALDLENQGAGVGGFSGRNSFGLSASFLSANLTSGLELFTEILISPAFEDEEVEKIKLDILLKQKAQDENLAGRVIRLSNKLLYEGHPYSQRVIGEPETISNLTSSDLKKTYQKLVKPENLLIVVSGDVDPSKLQSLFNELLKDWQPRGQKIQDNWLKEIKAPQIKYPAKAVEKLNRAQTHLTLAFNAPGLDDPQRAAFEVLNSYFSGMGGVLFSELRDKQSLAYTVTSIYSPGLNDWGGMIFYIASAPSKEEEALRGMKKIIAEITLNPPTEEETERAKSYTLGLMKIRKQSLASKAEETLFDELYKLENNAEIKLEEAISKVTAKDLQIIASKYLVLDKAVLAKIEGSWEAYER